MSSTQVPLTINGTRYLDNIPERMRSWPPFDGMFDLFTPEEIVAESGGVEFNGDVWNRVLPPTAPLDVFVAYCNEGKFTFTSHTQVEAAHKLWSEFFQSVQDGDLLTDLRRASLEYAHASPSLESESYVAVSAYALRQAPPVLNTTVLHSLEELTPLGDLYDVVKTLEFGEALAEWGDKTIGRLLEFELARQTKLWVEEYHEDLERWVDFVRDVRSRGWALLENAYSHDYATTEEEDERRSAWLAKVGPDLPLPPGIALCSYADYQRDVLDKNRKLLHDDIHKETSYEALKKTALASKLTAADVFQF